MSKLDPQEWSTCTESSSRAVVSGARENPSRMKGFTSSRRKYHDVIAAAAPRMGMTASSILATKMAITFRPRYLAITGILAGIRGACELGDILVADPGWDYESGKRLLRDDRPTFAAAPHQIGLDPFLRGKLARMAQDRALLDEVRRGWVGQATTTVLNMRLGPVASGAAVLEDPAIVAGIQQQHRKTLARIMHGPHKMNEKTIYSMR